MAWSRRAGRRAACLGGSLLAVMASGCATQLQPMGPVLAAPVVTDQAFVTPDGVALHLRRWLPDDPPRAVIVALHGMNDYSTAFDGPGRHWATVGLATYAYDQRGFGASPRGGVWAGADTMVADLSAAVDAIRREHPAIPLVVLGESMGGAIVAHALETGIQSGDNRAAASGALPFSARIDGAVLSAPALWGPAAMPWPARVALWLARRTVPAWIVTPPRGLRIVPSDNIDMLRSLGRDPLVRKQTRMDTLGGLTDLMAAADAGIGSWPRDLPMLVLYGQHEQVLPAEAVRRALASIEAHHADSALRVMVYDTGYHMLLRDSCARRVLDDVAAWVLAPREPLPGKAESLRWAPASGPAPRCAVNADGMAAPI
ncbi:MAG: lysophospholipase [Burkholderiaceae bacterium]|nr:lysophospholipase [Burkholderiaceae bacterium]